MLIALPASARLAFEQGILGAGYLPEG